MFRFLRLSPFQINILLIILIAAFLRFYNLPENFVFAGDEEYQAILAQSIVKDFHIIWIGVNAAHLGFYLGPYWTYFTSFWLYLSGGDPLITGYISSIIGVITTLMVIMVGSIVFNKQVGILAGLLYASLPLMVFYDQRYWNPSLIPLLSLLLFLSLYKLKHNPKLAILFTLSYGMVFHTHLSLFPIIFVAIFWAIHQKIKLPWAIFFLSILSFLMMIFPLIAFDYFHKGSNITTPLRFKAITSDEVNKIKPLFHFQALFQTLARVWYIKPPSVNADEVIAQCALSSRTDTKKELVMYSKRFNPPLLLSLMGTTILLLFLINRQTFQKNSNLLLSLFLTAIIIPFLLFPGPSFEYYLLGTFPLLLFLPGILTGYFKKINVIIFYSIIILAVLGIFTILTNKDDFGLQIKKDLIKQVISYLGKESFELKQTGICHTYEGWRYLFILEGKTPERSDSDQGMGWLYTDEITVNPTRYTIVMSESRVPIQFDKSASKTISSGGFTAHIFKNY